MRANQKRLLVAGAALVVGAGVFIAITASGGDDDPASERAKSEEVESAGRTFRYPTSAQGTAGGRTVLVNEDDVVHTFTSDAGLFDSGPLDPGGELVIETLPAGTYAFHCSIHPDLEGELEITG